MYTKLLLFVLVRSDCDGIIKVDRGSVAELVIRIQYIFRKGSELKESEFPFTNKNQNKNDKMNWISNNNDDIPFPSKKGCLFTVCVCLCVGYDFVGHWSVNERERTPSREHDD